MKTRYWVAIGALLILLAVGGLVLAKNLSTPSETTADKETEDETYKLIKACQVYTFSKAQEILGPNTKQGDDTPPIIQGKTLVSTCSYTNGASDAKSLQVSTVLLRCSTDDSSKEGFRAERSTGAEAVTGLGDDAYWDPTLAQLHILKGHNWAIITSGSSVIKERTPEQAKAVAALIISEL